jgi:6-phosphogluconolactonase
MNDMRVYPDPPALANAAADFITTLAAESITAQGAFSIALSGGSTPRALYRLLAERAVQINWSRWHCFWGDERCVPPDHEDSCYRMARETLLDHVPVPAAQIHRIPGELAPTDAARSYEQILRQYFTAAWPRFDLVLLGMGDDAHTASLFPNTSALDVHDAWVTANYAPTVKQSNRVTLTVPAINAAEYVLFLVSGSTKAAPLHQVIAGTRSPRELPAQFIQPTSGHLIWMVDQPAAALLNSKR